MTCSQISKQTFLEHRINHIMSEGIAHPGIHIKNIYNYVVILLQKIKKKDQFWYFCVLVLTTIIWELPKTQLCRTKYWNSRYHMCDVAIYKALLWVEILVKVIRKVPFPLQSPFQTNLTEVVMHFLMSLKCLSVYLFEIWLGYCSCVSGFAPISSSWGRQSQPFCHKDVSFTCCDRHLGASWRVKDQIIFFICDPCSDM